MGADGAASNGVAIVLLIVKEHLQFRHLVVIGVVHMRSWLDFWISF